MENTLNRLAVRRSRDIYYFRQRFKNRVFGRLVAFFAEEAERRGFTRRDLARALGRDPAQLSRWLSSPSNMTLDSISDLLLAMDAEVETPRIVRFSDRLKANDAHPLIRALEEKALVVPPLNDRTVKISLMPPRDDRTKKITLFDDGNTLNKKIKHLEISL